MSVSLLDFGSSSDPALLQTAINGLMAAGGGELVCPAGDYSFNPPTISYIGVPGRFAKRVHIIGEGSGSTNIGLPAGGINYQGNASYPESMFKMSGIRMTGAGTGVGLNMNIAAFATTDDVVIEGFDTGAIFEDVEQLELSNSIFRWNNHGSAFRAGDEVTDPNSILLKNVAIANNAISGLDVAKGNAFSMLAGSVQYNGEIDGGAAQYGMKLINFGSGYGTASFHGVAFEGNGGAGDVLIVQNTDSAIIDFDDCGFTRTSLWPPKGYGTNQISISGTAPVNVFLKNRHMYGAGYTPSAARPLIVNTNLAAKIYERGSIYPASVEAPPWAGSTMLPGPLVVGRQSALGALSVRAAANANFFAGAGFLPGGGVSVGAVNDANNALLPLELRTSRLSVTSLPTSPAGLPAGSFWNSSGIVKIV